MTYSVRGVAPPSLLQDFLTRLNNYYPTIEFISEKGGYGINFLDLNKSIMNNYHKFKIGCEKDCLA